MNLFDNPLLPQGLKDKLKAGAPIDMSFNYDFDRLDGYYSTSRTGTISLISKFAPLYDALGNLINILLINIDNTETTNAYSKIQDFEEFFTLIGNYAKVGYAHFNALKCDGYAVNSWYRNVGEKEGTPLNEIIKVHSHFHPDDRRMMLRFFDQVLIREASHLRRDVRILREDGTYTWTRVNVMVRDFRPEDGIIDMVCVNYDITELKETERKLIAARDKAEELDRLKSAFLANMSHEIRTPINVMLGMNEMILRESESKEIRQYAKSIERSGGYLISLINNILDISRIESGKMEIEEGKYELRQLLDEVMLIAEKQAEQKSLKMNLIFDKTLPAYLIGDVIHIKQILLNLINNAVKYTKEGQIDIKVSKNAEETKLIFEVKDTGIGIKEENLPVLFDAFMRVDSKKNKKIKGTGLGLAIAKQLAEQMDGMIWVESVYGKGSSFFVQLPMKKVSDGKISNVEWKETDERKRRSFVAPQAKILIVDDNPENLMVTRSLLKRTAVFVDTAASGEECVHKVRQNIYDLILLDYMMPQMDGIDTIRELKKDVQFHIPVIALTADVTKGIEQTFLREGFCAYLSKPVMWSKLEDLLMKYLRDDLVFIREDLKEEQKIKDEEFKQLKGQLKENDIKIEEGLRLLDGDFMQYRKLMEFFMEYQEEYMRQMQQLMTQNEVKVDEITRMMHTLKSNAKAIGAIHLYEIAKEMEDRGKQKDMEYIMSAYDLLKLEWGRVFKASREFIEQTKNVLFDQKKEEEKDKQSKEEIKEKLKIFITRYQAKEAKEQIQYYRKGKISEEERNILKEMEIRIDQLDFDEAEILMKRWEGME